MATDEELKRLPRRAIVAYAARCARRVRPLYRLPQDFPDRVKHETAVDRAIESVENFAAGGIMDAADWTTATMDAIAVAAARYAAASPAAWAAAFAADAARHAAVADWAVADVARDAAADAAWADTNALAAVCAAWAAAAGDPWDAADAATTADYERLLELHLGDFPDLGEPVDPSEAGPLGPLWPGGEPEWLP